MYMMEWSIYTPLYTSVYRRLEKGKGTLELYINSELLRQIRPIGLRCDMI